MYYINAVTSISHQDSFGNKGFTKGMLPLVEKSELIKPEYKKYIDPKLIRRMSNILRMSIACATKALAQANISTTEGIIVGTGLGCLTDTEKFLNNAIVIEGLLPPTSFIQSTHNTIAGQISLSLQNNGYNITHSQNTVSFEIALQDAMMCIDEGMDSVLIGSADESIPLIGEVINELGLENLKSTSGATFMVLSKHKTEDSIASVLACETFFQCKNSSSSIVDFLSRYQLKLQDIDVLGRSASFDGKRDNLGLSIEKEFNINDFAGVYPTNAAFAAHVVADYLEISSKKTGLVLNTLGKENLGLTLIQSI